MTQTLCAFRPYVIEIYASNKRARRQLKWLFPRVLREGKRTLKAGHRSTLAFLRFCVIAATGIRKHTQVESLWITRRIRRISAFPSNSELLDASVCTSTLPATKRNRRTISTRATDVIFERKHCSRRRSHTHV